MKREIPDRFRTPVLVIGTGIAGLTTALVLARRGLKVHLVTKAVEPDDCNTAWAQGGIIYFGKNDSPASLEKDILRAGAGLCNPEAVRFLAERGPRVRMNDSESEPNSEWRTQRSTPSTRCSTACSRE